MRINHNISSINTNRLLVGNNSATSKNLEKLSSGLSINRAGDNAAGLAISEKMRGQIRGLNQASDNANDGISLIQTAEGGLNETHSILQRMRELAVQSANDTNTDSDRKEIQKEVDQLATEITRISTDTEFNTKKLLNGDLAADGTTTDANFNVSVAAGANIAAGTYTVTYTGSQGEAGIAAVPASAGAVTDSDDTKAVVANVETLMTGLGTHAPAAVAAGGAANTAAITITETAAGVYKIADGAGDIETGLSAAQMSTKYGITMTSAGAGTLGTSSFTLTGAKNAKAEKLATFEISSIVDASGANVSASSFNIDLSTTGKTADLSAGGTFDITVNANKALTFHIGANSGQNTKLTVQNMSATAIGVDAIDLTSQASSDAAITTIDTAINTVSAQRAALGAMQNRLEHTINNLGTSSENLSAAESQIRDVDMAEEMSNYTKNNILVQAATSMLAQANQQPQSVLSLLQG